MPRPAFDSSVRERAMRRMPDEIHRAVDELMCAADAAPEKAEKARLLKEAHGLLMSYVNAISAANRLTTTEH